MKSAWLRAWTGAALGLWLHQGWASPLKTDEELVFFPGLAHVLDSGDWRLRLHGWVFEPELGGAAKQAVRAWLGLPPDDASDDALWRQRTRGFRVDNEGGKRVAVRLGTREWVLPESGDDGHIRAELRLSAEEFAALRPLLRDGWLDFTAVLPAGDPRRFGGRIQVLEAEGVSVISDIDDTVKISQVLDKAELIANTFSREFQPSPGMVELYRGWRERGAQFHYVSASPWQLYPPLSEFFQRVGLPAGSFELRALRFSATSLRQFMQGSQPHKHASIAELFERLPRRRFILVGDSGEHDPEIYAEFARSYPERVIAVLVRDVTGEPLESPRYRGLRGDSVVPWQVFAEPSNLTPVW